MSTDRFEISFRNEASFVGAVHLTGKVDRLRINHKNRTIVITDFKTGQPYKRWVGNNIRLHKYRQQLLLYKLLVEGSKTYRRYTVKKGIIEFVEPDEAGNIIQLEFDYDDAEMANFRKLVQVVWQKIKLLDIGEKQNYAPTIAGIKQFEKELINSWDERKS